MVRILKSSIVENEANIIIAIGSNIFLSELRASGATSDKESRNSSYVHLLETSVLESIDNLFFATDYLSSGRITLKPLYVLPHIVIYRLNTPLIKVKLPKPLILDQFKTINDLGHKKLAIVEYIVSETEFGPMKQEIVDTAFERLKHDLAVSCYREHKVASRDMPQGLKQNAIKKAKLDLALTKIYQQKRLGDRSPNELFECDKYIFERQKQDKAMNYLVGLAS